MIDRKSKLNLVAGDPDPNVEWQLWYCDMFDREDPPKVDVYGTGLVVGLMELWPRHLAEGNGFSGYSAFSLQFKSDRQDIEVSGNKSDLTLLSQWILEGRSVRDGYREAAEPILLSRVAAAHARLIQRGENLDALFGLAQQCPSRGEFLDRLDKL